jgi:hypothetical protein
VRDQATLAGALARIEDSFPASPAGVLIYSVGYGVPYFSRLPPALVARHMPTIHADPSRPVLEEARPFPTDVVDGLVGGRRAVIRGVTKDRFNVGVQVESNDMLIQLRSDSPTAAARRSSTTCTRAGTRPGWGPGTAGADSPRPTPG